MSTTSCRRLTLAAGAILAGAVIPITAAASAWADGLTETEDFGQLVGQGLNYYEAYEVVEAESNGLPVEVSYDGQVVVEDNEPTDPLLGAFAESGSGTDVAAAIATNSPAIENQTIADALLGSNNVAFADGGGSFALAGNEVPTSISNYDTATAIGTYSFAYATSGSNNSATDIGSNSFADSTGNHDITYDVGSGVGNGANSISAGGDNDFVIGFGNGLPNTDVVNTGVFDIVTPQSGESGAASAASAAADTTDPVVPVDGGASAVLNGDTIVLNPYPPAELITTISNPLDTQVISLQAFSLDPPGESGIYDGEYFQGTVNDTTFSSGPPTSTSTSPSATKTSPRRRAPSSTSSITAADLRMPTPTLWVLHPPMRSSHRSATSLSLLGSSNSSDRISSSRQSKPRRRPRPALSTPR